MNIRYRPAALAQLDKIFTDVASNNRKAARRIRASIKRSIDLLADFPYSGRASEVADIRELPIVRYPYIVFYTVDNISHEVQILRIRHTSQDPAGHLAEL